MGHTAVGFLEDDRLQVPAVNVPDELFACITHNMYEENLESIITNGLLPGGGGTSHVVHSQLSAFSRKQSWQHDDGSYSLQRGENQTAASRVCKWRPRHETLSAGWIH